MTDETFDLLHSAFKVLWILAVLAFGMVLERRVSRLERRDRDER